MVIESMENSKTFRERLLSGEPLIGTWVKTPSPIVAEVLALTDLDCLCYDAEHAPFDRLTLDSAIAAGRAGAMPSLVRIPHMSSEYILNALDCGADGIVAPHIKTAAEAEQLAKLSHFGAAGRGYAGSTRSAGYGMKGLAENLEDARKNTTVIAQIEDLEALDATDQIASVEGVDCLFIGRIDLTVALGANSPAEQTVVNAVEAICASGKKHNRRIGMFVSDIGEIPRWIDSGASLFIIKSDHTFLLEGAKKLRDDFDQASANLTR